ncbi:hypothetical protein MROS_2522 [Melioribacter roseus P3M-2]|uniref:Uncharacterized protein n=1 Tax=Melioribacter roseus (strain DSM 23840 / JCM 17771 / VKM B-2668 / P3M-2) TaxID=1191523 RepID=I6YYU1_MELRP|nr:hypothetical protein [Melioribacter roseus]AFN75752.1 hypothetical protein MROS_2522 [Melioribacter roseus P3M-2]
MKKNDIYENIEYIVVNKNKQQLEIIDGEQVNGKNKTYLQKYLGNKFGSGRYSLSIKKIGEQRNIVQNINGLVTETKNKTPEDSKIDLLFEKIDSLLANKSNNNFDIQSIIAMKDEAFKIQIQFYQERIKQLENEIEKLRSEDSESSGTDILNMILPLLIKNKNE